MKHRFAPQMQKLNLGARAMSAPISLSFSPLVLVERPKEGPAPIPRRAKLWELSRYLHCSVVGTCLSTAELRHVLAKSGFVTDGATDHDLHGKGVTVAGQHDTAGKLLHKALDKRHRQSITEFAKAKGESELAQIWSEARARGDIPGAYWAALTHPEATDELVREMFGEVHMLSHLVGAANRADIRRLTELEAENAELREKLRRQETHLRDGISSREQKIRDLQQLLAKQIADPARTANPSPQTSEQATLATLVADVERRLGAERRRRSAVEARVDALLEGSRKAQEAQAAAEAREQSLQKELDALEATIVSAADRGAATESTGRFDSLSVLYVGGRPQQHNHLKSVAVPMGIEMLFHDGGIEDRHGLLAGLVSRADVVMFPVDCVSHEAVSAVKRLCRNASKPFAPLRSGGISSFLAAVDRVAAARAGGGVAASLSA